MARLAQKTARPVNRAWFEQNPIATSCSNYILRGRGAASKAGFECWPRAPTPSCCSCPCQASLPARFRAQLDPLAASTGFEGIRSWPSSGSRHWRSLGRVPKLLQVLERVGRGKTVAEQGHVPPAQKNQVKPAYLLQILFGLVQQRCIRRIAACSLTCCHSMVCGHVHSFENCRRVE